MRIILASKSPRRREILETLGVKFEIITRETDETCEETDPCRLVEELARRKGEEVLDSLDKTDDFLIISADTVVACDDPEYPGKQIILGKPHNAENSKKMLRLLSGSCHRVVGGICVILCQNGKITREISHDVTEVWFDEISDADIDKYVSTGEPFDKAGAYAIQGTASVFIKGINGNYFNVVGLPVNKLYNLLKDKFGISLT